MSPEWLGWLSSLILLITLGKQIYKQWSEHNSLGVSKWLYAGQFSAEIGFIVYSAILRNWVFVVTNSVLLLENLVGLGIVIHHRRQRGRALSSGAALKYPLVEDSSRKLTKKARETG